MFNWFQQAKELVSPPSIQMGQPIPANSDQSTNPVKKKKVEEESEITEEGFVCVGNSSFYSVEATPYPPSPMQSPFQNTPHHQMYPQLPTPMLNHNYQKTSESLEQVNEFIRHVPFVLNPALRPQTTIYDPLSPLHSTNHRKTVDWSLFDYDFDYERSVIREVNQHFASSG